MIKGLPLLILSLLFSIPNLFGQGPAPAMIADSALVNSGSTVDIQFTVDNGDFWNITNYNGTITWDSSVATFNSFVSGQLFNISITTFNTSQVSSGILTYTWTHWNTVGQTLANGSEIFTLKFNAVGNAGDSTDIDFASSPVPMYWYNFAAWSGVPITTPGQIKIAGVPCTAPVSDFSASGTLQNWNFTNNSSTIYSTTPTYIWDFGDGNNSTLTNPSHTFSNAGVYTVCLDITDSCSTVQYCQSVSACQLPTPAFTTTANGVDVDFTDATVSTFGGLEYYWDFGDGNVDSVANPSHTYAGSGSYSVCLWTTDSCGIDSVCITIDVCAIPAASFTFSANGLDLVFSNTTAPSPNQQLSWDFGDGNSSTSATPSHTYAVEGFYNICLLITDSCGVDSVCELLNICEITKPEFVINGIGVVRQFLNQTPIEPFQIFSWDFGDGNTSSQTSPNHQFDTLGNYTVCLTITDTCGTDSTCHYIEMIPDDPGNGIDDLKELDDLQVFPNPSSDHFYLSSKMWTGKKVSIQVVSITGAEIVNTNMVLNAQQQIDASQWVNGIYLLKVTTPKGIITRRLTVL